MKMATKAEAYELIRYFPDLYVARTKNRYYVEERMSAMNRLDWIRRGKPHGKRHR